MKRSIRRLRNILWSLLLSAAIVIESTAGASVVYATEITDQQTTPDASEIIEESGESSEDPGEGDDENNGNVSGTEGEETDENEKEDPEGTEDPESTEGSEDTEDSDQKDDDEDSGELGGGDISNPDKEESDGNVEDSSEESEENGDDSEDEVIIKGPGSEEEESEESEDPLAALESIDSPISKDLEAMRAELDEWARETGRIPNGYHDVDYDVDNLTESVKSSDDSFPQAYMADTVPAKYDARVYGKVSSVRNQAGWGTCWAFSAVNSAESAYKIMNGGSEANLSETHLVNFFYNGNYNIDLAGPDGGLAGDKTTALNESPVQRGGNSLFTTFALASWAGVANEADAQALVYPEALYTYNNNDFPMPIGAEYAYQDAMHLENAYWINLSDKSNVKKAVMEYGTVGVSYYSDSIYDSDAYKRSYNSTYTGPAVYYDPEHTGTNHAVAIVGWDDTFDKDYFKNTWYYAYCEASGYKDSDLQKLLPKGNGAWLIKNSWGENVSDGGYFWMSYENACLKNGTAYAFDFKSADNYDHNYQYDGSNGLYSLGGTTELTAANVYTAQGDEVIEAVGVGFASTSTSYTVKIYKNVKNENNPESGVLASTVTGKTSFEGFYTIPIEKPVCVEPGEKFGIVVTAKKSSGAYLFIDYSYTNGNWVSFTASTKNDKTYLKSGSTWTNVGKNNKYTFRIKAYTRDINLEELEIAKEGDKVLRKDMLEEIAPQVYNGGEVKPEPTLMFNGEMLTEGSDYEVEFSNNTSAGMATMFIKAKEGSGYTGEFTTNFTITKKPITADMIEDISGRIYDATGYTPDITVSNGGNPMALNTDYTIKYNKTPLAAGTYTATVTATKNSSYSGSAKKTFTIGKLDLESEYITLEYDTVEYTGAEKKPKITVMYNGNMIAASNYTVKYTSNKAAGEATVTITGKGNCQGKVTKNFTIDPKHLTAESVTVKNGTYTGSEVKPAVTVKDGKTTLKLNRDYELVYDNNTDATTEAKVTVKGLGNYRGTEVEKNFEIARQTVAANKIKVEAVEESSGSSCIVTIGGKKVEPGKDYNLMIYNPGTTESVAENSLKSTDKYDISVELTGNYQNAKNTPAKFSKVSCKRSIESFTVAFKKPADPAAPGTTSVTYNGKAQKPAIQVIMDEDGTLLSTKYYNVSYADNVNAGTATITVTGKGNYSGTKTASFDIDRKQAALKISIPAQTYANKELTPAVTIKDGKTKLKVGRDYTVAYSDNMNATSEEEKAKATITLVNYERKIDGEEDTQTKFTAEFVINPAKISSVKLSGLCYYKGGNAITPAVIVKAGKLDLTNDVDYTVDYKNNENVSTSKSKASVTVTGQGNFKGAKTVKYSITKEPLSKAKWGESNKLENVVYSGEAIKPDLSLINSAGEVIPTDAYTVTYKNNKNVGTASVTIKPTAGSIYGGSATKKFKITKADLSNMLETTGTLEAKTYTGSKQTYKTAEIQGVVSAKVTGDKPTYKISYSNNVNAGTATVILTGSGNYQGKVEIHFTINRCNVNDPSVKITLQSTSVSLGNSPSALAKIKQAVYGKLKLKANKDYTLSYVNSSKTGVAAVKVTGAGNYTGTKQIMYVVVR